MLVLRAAEQLDQDAVMQIDQLIDHGRGALQHHGGRSRRVAALRLEPRSLGVICPPSRASLSRRFWWMCRPSLRASPPTEMSSAARCVPACAESWVSAVPGAASQPVMLLPALSFNSSSSLARCESVSGSTRAR